MAKSLPLVQLGEVKDGRFTTPTLYVKTEGKVRDWYGVVYATINGVETDIEPLLPNEKHPYGMKTDAHGHYFTVAGQVGGKHPILNLQKSRLVRI